MRFSGGRGWKLIDSSREQIERGRRAFVQIAAPFGVILRPRGFGIERRVAGFHCECAMQLGGAHAECLHQRQVGAVHAGRHLCCRALRVEKARDILHRVGPRVALVANVGLQHRERGERTVACDVLDDAGERHAMRKVRDFGEEAADLDFRVYTAAHASIRFEEQALPEGDDRVAAGAFRNADG